MMDAFAYTLKFLVLADFVGAFSFRKLFADSGKRFKSVFAQKKAVYYLRVMFRRGKNRVHSAYGKLVCQFVTH
jgi:hypothetical protein